MRLKNLITVGIFQKFGFCNTNLLQHFCCNTSATEVLHSTQLSEGHLQVKALQNATGLLKNATERLKKWRN
jgi:hypothetical protein